MSSSPSSQDTLTVLAGNQRLWDAIVEANRVHRDQTSHMGGHYIPHPLHLVMIHLQCGYRLDDSDDLDVMLADTQHDGPEDCPHETSFERVEQLYGGEVRRIVQAVTHDSPNYDRFAERERILQDDRKVQSVKMADVAANSIRIAEAIRRLGLQTVETFLKQSIAERVKMERAFVSRCLGNCPGARERDWKLKTLTLQTIDALEEASLAA